MNKFIVWALSAIVALLCFTAYEAKFGSRPEKYEYCWQAIEKSTMSNTRMTPVNRKFCYIDLEGEKMRQGKPNSNGTWVSAEELRNVDNMIYKNCHINLEGWEYVGTLMDKGDHIYVLTRRVKK